MIGPLPRGQFRRRGSVVDPDRCRHGHFARARHRGRACPHPTGSLHRAWLEYLATALAAAEDACSGYLVARTAPRYVTAEDLYRAHRQHARHASADLRLAWDRGIVPRPLSFTEFRRAA